MAFLKECPYCGKIYKSKHYFKRHIKKHKEEIKEPAVQELIKRVEKPVKISRKPEQIKVQYKQVVHVGTADVATIRGTVTGKIYSFVKDESKMPKPVNVDEKDYSGVIALKGKGCARRDPNALFMSKQDGDLEIAEARSVNR